MFKKILRFSFVFLIILGWLLSGWPKLWQNPPIPPKITKAQADTLTLRPNASGDLQEWETLVGSSHWGATSDQTDATYIETTGSSSKSDIQNLQDPTFGDSDTINSVTYYIRYYVTNGGAQREKIYLFEKSGSSRLTDSGNLARTQWTDISFTKTTAPDGGSWTKAKIDALQAGAQVFALALGESISISEIWIVVDYSPSAVVSVSVSDGVVSYGTMDLGTSKTTVDLSDTQTLTNDGNVTENFNIRGQNSECPWTLSSTSGSDQYVHQFCKKSDNTCGSPPTNYTALITDYQALYTGVAQSATRDIDLRIILPTSSSCLTTQSVNVTIQAVQQ